MKVLSSIFWIYFDTRFGLIRQLKRNITFSYLFLLQVMEQHPQQHQNYGHIDNICLLGYGTIGRGVLPLILRHFTFSHLTIIDPHPVEAPVPNEKYTFVQLAITKDNLAEELDKIFVNGSGFCVNVSVGVQSLSVILYCQKKGVLYIDTCKEEELDYYYASDIPISEKGNYWIRERIFASVKKHNYKTTAVSTCGANPGMVSWLLKQALVNIAKDTGYPMEQQPKTKAEWGLLMKNLGVKGVHVAERDTQRANIFKPEDQFWNTWSCEAFMGEGNYMNAQLGWGTHEKWEPHNARHYAEGCQASIYLDTPGVSVQVRSWCPTFGPQFGYLVSHDESTTIADYFTVKEEGKTVFRPTVHYAYHPIPEAVASVLNVLGTGIIPDRSKWRILQNEIVSGFDELGVLVYGHAKNAYWYGSQLDIESTRKRAPNQNATALQVTSAIIAGMVWALKNPEAGYVECDQLDYKECLAIQHEYISPVNGYYTDWTPLKHRLLENQTQNLDLEDPWQFKNILITK